jgi:hypothetical protein
MTPTQRTILLAIGYHRARLGWPPTVRQLLAALHGLGEYTAHTPPACQAARDGAGGLATERKPHTPPHGGREGGARVMGLRTDLTCDTCGTRSRLRHRYMLPDGETWVLPDGWKSRQVVSGGSVNPERLGQYDCPYCRQKYDGGEVK